jgi:ComF family protein
MKEWLARYKYRGDERLSGLMGDLLLHAYRLHRSSGAAAPELLTFVPISETRRADRGFNQAEQMARELGKRLKLPVVPLLQRNRHTEKQSLKKRSDRVRDMRGIFTLHEEGRIALSRLKTHLPGIYIVDDVYTTGSTLNECAKAIRTSADARVYGLTLAR